MSASPWTPMATEWDRVVEAVAMEFRLSEEELLGRSRQLRVAWPRHLATYLLREDCGLSLPMIGSVTGRDHTSALHSIRTIETQLRLDGKLGQELATRIERIRRRYQAVA